MAIKKTVIISCAGMGKRLGIGTTKALIDICGRPLIIRTIEQLASCNDVRIVAGYQAEQLIQTVNACRKDITYVFNHNFMYNGTGASVSMGARYSNDYILTIDGDLLLHPQDMEAILKQEGEFIGVTNVCSENPVKVTLDAEGLVTAFSRERGSHEWTGVCQICGSRLRYGEGHVYQLLEPLLPIRGFYIRTKEIDTVKDYENAIEWVKNKYH